MLPIKSIIFDKIDKTDWKIDKYQFLTTNPFIDFYRFPIQSTNFIECYRLLILSIAQVGCKISDLGLGKGKIMEKSDRSQSDS